jgi:hypothetical protein
MSRRYRRHRGACVKSVKKSKTASGGRAIEIVCVNRRIAMTVI